MKEACHLKLMRELHDNKVLCQWTSFIAHLNAYSKLDYKAIFENIKICWYYNVILPA